MKGLFGMARQKFPFTIENILNKFPEKSNEEINRLDSAALGLKEKAEGSTAGRPTETVHHTCCLSCCCCFHCGEVFHSDFIHESKSRNLCVWFLVWINQCFSNGNYYFLSFKMPVTMEHVVLSILNKDAYRQ